MCYPGIPSSGSLGDSAKHRRCFLLQAAMVVGAVIQPAQTETIGAARGDDGGGGGGGGALKRCLCSPTRHPGSFRCRYHHGVYESSRANTTTMASRRAQFNQQVLIDTTPLPEDVPAVKEIGASSAPLLSASFFIGARCRDYNDDFMQCKTENPGRGEFACLKEGRRVTRCASSVIQDINSHCLVEFRKHWQCIDNRNQQLWQCRPAEWKLNKCVYENLNIEKKIPDQPTNVTPVELRPKQIFADVRIGPGDGKPFVPEQSEASQ